jgi:hypothetical protein
MAEMRLGQGTACNTLARLRILSTAAELARDLTHTGLRVKDVSGPPGRLGERRARVNQPCPQRRFGGILPVGAPL